MIVKKGKYFSFPTLIKSNTNWDITSYIDSKITCHGFGMKKKEDLLKQFLLELNRYKVPLKHDKAITFTSNAFVIEKSKLNIFIGINDNI